MNISAVLLAGGESRRMGQDKAMLMFRGSALWEHQLELLRELRPAEIYVSARLDPAWRPADVQFVADDPPSRGPLSGIAATLLRITTSHLLALAVDMPFMTAEYIRFLYRGLAAGRGTIPILHGRAEPLAAIYPRHAHADLTDALSGDDFSMQSALQRLIGSEKMDRFEVSKQDEALFRNLNEPADLKVDRPLRGRC